MSYLAFSIPALVAGLLITHVGLRDTALGYGGFVAVLAVSTSLNWVRGAGDATLTGMQVEHIEAASSRTSRIRSAAALPPVRRRNVWVAAGIVVQLIAVALPIAVVVTRAKHDSVAGTALRATVLVAARDLLHSSSGLAILAASAVVFAFGSVLLARPFVRSVATLVIAVPIAAVIGVLVLGVLAVVVAILAALVSADVPGGTGARKRRSRDQKRA